MSFDIFDSTILLTRAGSRAYGIHTPSSDLDLKGVAIPPTALILGLEGFEQVDSPERFKDQRFLDLLTEDEREIVKATKLEGSIYELRKLCLLALAANPNILDVLFAREEDILLITPLGRKLREHRDLFISAKCKHSFSGYAVSQLKRIQLHRQFLFNPNEHKPTRAEFDLPESTLIPADQLAAAESMVKKKMDSWEIDLSTVADDSDRLRIMLQLQDSMSEMVAGVRTDISEQDAKWRAAVKAVGIDDNLLLVMDRERKYKGAKTDYDSFQQWKRTRNKDRAALEAAYGYDVKHGAHLFRLLTMAHEILDTGKVNVWRGDIDAEEIKAIRRGEWSYEKLLDFATTSDNLLTEKYNAKKYVIPHSPNKKAVDAMVVELMSACLKERLTL